MTCYIKNSFTIFYKQKNYLNEFMYPTTMQQNTRISIASPNDLERIIAIEKICFPKELAYTRRQLRYLLMKANSTVLIEKNGTLLRGFIIILYRRGTKVAGIETINVDPEYRKKGIGHRLLTTAEERIRKKGFQKIRLEVSTTNHAAIALYKNAGFKKTALLKKYYSYDHEGSRDAIRMVKELP
jgi:ribosomal-protein-alanine N-acetyltransferase